MQYDIIPPKKYLSERKKQIMKKIALLGKPNVGKSSLFNRIARERTAITSDVSGTTRDVKEKEVFIGDKEAVIIDTGGLDESNIMFKKVKEKSLRAAEKADIILYMVDGKYLPDDEDKKIFFELQKLNKPIALIVNKVDNDKMREAAWEFVSFGAKNLFTISVSHNREVGKLLYWLERQLPKAKNEMIQEDDEEDFESFLLSLEGETKSEEDSKEIKIAIIGRVNVGKSSLLNALVGEDRAVVSEIAGTTIDPVNDYIPYQEKILTFVDTAGIRRKGRIEGIERYALNRTEKMLEDADIALLVLDASEELKELDERIANLIDKFQLGCIIILNKWDKALKSYEKSVEDVRYRFKFLSYAPILTVSALTKKRVERIKDKILEVYQNYSRRISTSKLNDLIKFANIKHHLPTDKGKEIKIYFATQFDAKPPKIALVMNRPKALHFSYKRYLINQLRENFNFEGTPLILIPKKRGAQEKESK